MTFTTPVYLFFFLPFAWVLYALSCKLTLKHAKSIVLIALSILFYAWSDTASLPTLLLLTIFNVASGFELYELVHAQKQLYARIALGISIALNVLVLALYKYSFLALPLGISFYTFSAISYLADIFLKREEQKPRILNSVLYILFFPKLVMGPIAQYQSFNKQIDNACPSAESISFGVYNILVGMFYKLLIADPLGTTFAFVKALSYKSALSTLVGTLAYGFQLYFDFAGYSLIAIGTAALFGFHLPKNFNTPYRSTSITDFWRRWHITLGAWFKNYIYIPLGGNRVNPPRHIVNLLVVWILTGIWHGSTLPFVIWGLYHGVFVIAEKYVLNHITRLMPTWIKILVTNIIVFAGWIFFFNPNMSDTFAWFATLFGHGTTMSDAQGIYLLASNACLLIVALIASVTKLTLIVKQLFASRSKLVRITMIVIFGLLFVACLAQMMSSTVSTFMYAKF